MPSYWPDGIDLLDSATPLEILHEAQQEWENQSGGVLVLLIQEQETEAREQCYVVHVQHVPSNRTVTLFSVLHRADLPYPACIQPIHAELPANLVKSRSVIARQAEFISATATAAGRSLSKDVEQTIENKWVCDTPGEFRRKLQEVLSLGGVKAEVQSLLATARVLRKENGAAQNPKNLPPADKP